MTAAIYDKLRESIEEYGMVDPLTVRPIDVKGETQWQIIDGEHRFDVAVALGYDMFDCIEILGLTDAQAKKLTIIMNELHGQPDPDRMGPLLQSIIDDSSLDELFKALPYDPSVVAAFLGSDDLPKLDDLPKPAAKADSDKEQWAERTFRMPKQVALVVDEAIEKAKDGEEIEAWRGLERVAADYLAG